MNHDERGAVAVEAVYVIPGLILLIALAVAGGRVWYVQTALGEVAHGSARAGSLASGRAGATRAATGFAERQLDRWTTPCHERVIATDTSRFGRGGELGLVRVEVACHVDLSDLILPGLPGSVRLAADAESIVETHRGRA